MLNKIFKRIAMIFLLAALAAGLAQAQGTAFTYQGRLTDGGNPADGMYDMQFKPFDTPTVGTGIQQGMTLTFSTVQVENGVFTILLNFGAGIFTGPARFLEIGVRPTGSADPYTILEPRQAITTTPYAMRASTAGGADTATNATQLGGVAASQYVLTTDSRLSDARNPLAGSSFYIQNRMTQQASTNFNISGTGTANIYNAATQYNLGGSRVLSNAGLNNLFAGVAAGASNTTGGQNAFFGQSAGPSNTTGGFNSFFGSFAGFDNTAGESNSFFGSSTGAHNTTGNNNSFFGILAGNANSIGSNNTFVGNSAGISNTSENNNTFIGTLTDGAAGITNATAIGKSAKVTQSNSLVLGSINGVNGATASTNVGIGTTAPKSKLHVQGGNIYIAQPNSLIITSPNGACWFITVSNTGALSTISVTCP